MLALIKFDGKKWVVYNRDKGVLYPSYVYEKAKDFQVAYNLGVLHAREISLS